MPQRSCCAIAWPAWKCWAVVAITCAASAPMFAQHTIVIDERNDRLLRFGIPGGMLIDHFVCEGLGGLDNPRAMALGPEGDIHVTSQEGVYTYDDQTGEFMGRLIVTGQGGLNSPIGMTFDSEGRIYVCSAGTNEILRFTSRGIFIDVFVKRGAGGLNRPHRGILFDTDGSLLVCSLDSNAVLRFDGETGDFLGYAIEPGAAGLDGPTGMVQAPDGTLFVCSYRSGAIVIRDPDGTVRPMWPAGEEPIFRCEDVVLQDNGTLVIAASNTVYRYSRAGVAQGTAVSSGSIPRDWKPVSVLIQPPESETCRADFNGDGTLDIFDFLAFQNAFAEGCR